MTYREALATKTCIYKYIYNYKYVASIYNIERERKVSEIGHVNIIDMGIDSMVNSIWVTTIISANGYAT